MARNKKVDITPRKSPRQARSQEMQSSILAAARRLLLRQGYAGFNTNRIAEATGISIGSLYQYFPNQESIALCLLENLLAGAVARNRQRTPDFLALPIPKAMELMTRTLIQSRADFKLYRILAEESPQEPPRSAVKKFHETMIQLLYERFTLRRDEIRVRNKYQAAFVIFYLYESVIRSVDRFEHKVNLEEILAEINRMIMAYLNSGDLTA